MVKRDGLSSDKQYGVLDYNLTPPAADSGHYDLSYDEAVAFATARIETRMNQLTLLPTFPTVREYRLSSDPTTIQVLSILDRLIEGIHH